MTKRRFLAVCCVILAAGVFAFCHHQTTQKSEEPYKIIEQPVEVEFDESVVFDDEEIETRDVIDKLYKFYGFYSDNVPYELRRSADGDPIMRISFFSSKYGVCCMVLEDEKTGTCVTVGDSSTDRRRIDESVGYDKEGNRVFDNRFITRNQVVLLAYVLEHYDAGSNWQTRVDDENHEEQNYWNPFDRLLGNAEMVSNDMSEFYYQIS